MTDTQGPLAESDALSWVGSECDAAVIDRPIGEPGCFAMVFDRHAPAIYRFIARRLGRDAADDLVAETFLIAFQRRGGYDQAQMGARPWLYGIATNLIGRRRREEVRFLRAISRTAAAVPGESVADRVVERVDAEAVGSQLAAALAGLSGPNRDTLIYTDTRAADPGNDVVWRMQAWQSVDGMRAGASRWTKSMVATGQPPDVQTRVLPSCVAKLPAGRSANPIDRTYAGLRTLPTRPGAMLAWLKRHATCERQPAMRVPEDIAAYAEIFMILGTVETPPPKIAAALFRAAARIPGVTVLRDAADAAGGHGVAVAMTFAIRSWPLTTYELIFDPHTYRYIGQQQIAMRTPHGPGRLMSATTLVASKVVNAAPTDYSGNSMSGTPSCV